MASVKKTATKTGDTRYRVRYRSPDGASREKWFRRRVDADKFAVSVQADIDRNEFIDPSAGRTPFTQVADAWMETRRDKAQSTRDRDQSYLNSMVLPAFGTRQIASIRPSQITSWLAGLDRAPTTKLRAFQILKAILEVARKDRMTVYNPAADVDPPEAKALRARVALTDAQARAVIQAAEEVDERSAVLVHLMARCGLRVGEAMALRVRDVDLGRRQVSVMTSMSRREGVRPVKGRDREDEGRTIPMPDDVVARLRRHLADRPVIGLDDFVATAPRGGPLRYDNWRSRVGRRIVERAGLDITPHDLRSTAATRLFLEDRWTPPEVQAFLGHRDPKTTLAIYTRVTSESLPRPSTLTRRTV